MVQLHDPPSFSSSRRLARLPSGNPTAEDYEGYNHEQPSGKDTTTPEQIHEPRDEESQQSSAALEFSSLMRIFAAYDDDDDDQDKLVGTILGCQYRVNRLIRHDNHAAVYSVEMFDRTDVSLEARAYSLCRISNNHLWYRRRNMRRLAHRVVYETKIDKKHILVYEIDQPPRQHETVPRGGHGATHKPRRISDPGRPDTLAAVACDTDELGGNIVSNSPKCDDHSEKARIRQQRRRARNRERNRGAAPIADGENHKDVVERARARPNPLERCLKTTLALHRLLKAKDSIATGTPHSGDLARRNDNDDAEAEALACYLRVDTVWEMDFSPLNLIPDLDRLKAYLDAQKAQLAFAQKLQRQRPRLVKMKTAERKRQIRRNATLTGSWEWEAGQEEIAAISNQLLALGEMELVFSDIVNTARERHEQMAKRFSLIKGLSDKNRYLYRAIVLVNELKLLEQRKAFYLLPFSPPNEASERRLQEKEKLRMLIGSYEGGGQRNCENLENLQMGPISLGACREAMKEGSSLQDHPDDSEDSENWSLFRSLFS